STVMLLSSVLVTATSGLPSALKSPTATELGWRPTPRVEDAVCPPAPSPSRSVTLLPDQFATARSGLPSRLKSPIATEVGLSPTTALESALSVPEAFATLNVTFTDDPKESDFANRTLPVYAPGAIG